MPLYEIIVAKKVEAKALAQQRAPLEGRAGFSCRPIEHVKIAKLAVLLGLGTFDSAMSALEPVAVGSEDGPWVSQLPPSWLAAVQNLGPLRLWLLAFRWGRTEEFSADRIGPREAREFLVSLKHHASLAQERQACVFLWGAL